MLPFLSTGVKLLKGLTNKAKKNGLKSANVIIKKTMAEPLNIPINSIYSPFKIPLPEPTKKQNTMLVNYGSIVRLLLPLAVVVLLFRIIFKK